MSLPWRPFPIQIVVGFPDGFCVAFAKSTPHRADEAITVCLIVLMAENIALYMVTAFSDMEHDDVELQDNMATFLEAAFDRLPRLKSAFWRSPAMTTDESFLDMFMLVILALTRDAPQLSVCSAAARVVWTLAWCRGLRTLCFSSTVMPSQLKLCSFKRFDLTYSAGEHVREALLRLRFDGGCNDLIFSGLGLMCRASIADSDATPMQTHPRYLSSLRRRRVLTSEGCRRRRSWFRSSAERGPIATPFVNGQETPDLKRHVHHFLEFRRGIGS